MSEGRQNIKERRGEIIRIISEGPVSTQTELLRRLKEAGYRITQATVSRDIRELGLVKTAGPGGGFIYKSPEKAEGSSEGPLDPLFGKSVVHADHAGNMVVVRTDAGLAQAVCAAIDRNSWEGILGTIAGDDTVFAVAANEEQAEAMVQKLKEIWK